MVSVSAPASELKETPDEARRDAGPTSRGFGVLLDGAALADEGALGAGARGWGTHEAALDGGPELGKARGAHDLAGEHRVCLSAVGNETAGC